MFLFEKSMSLILFKRHFILIILFQTLWYPINNNGFISVILKILIGRKCLKISTEI